MNQQLQLKKILSLIVTNTAKHHFQERWNLLKGTSKAGLFLDAVLEKLKASEDEKAPTATAKKHQEARSSSSVNYTAKNNIINGSQSRDYSDIAKYKVEDRRKCGVCGNVDNYKVCPECWFARGRFVPASSWEVQQ